MYAIFWKLNKYIYFKKQETIWGSRKCVFPILHNNNSIVSLNHWEIEQYFSDFQFSNKEEAWVGFKKNN